jgi:hypothetical protein
MRQKFLKDVFHMIEVSDTSQAKLGVPTRGVGVTSAGRPIDWFTNEQVDKCLLIASNETHRVTFCMII